MARTEGQWKKGISFISPADNVPILLENSYLNFGGSTIGESGYGIRDNAGAIEVKSSGGSWATIAAGGESNTAANLGAGEGIYASKIGVALNFKSLVAGTGMSLASDGNEITLTATSGSGDVVGPASAVDSNFAAFDTTTGKLIKDSGKATASFATAAQGITADSALQNVVEDTTPQLGGDLDTNGNDIKNIPSLDFDTTATTDAALGEMRYDADVENFVFGVDATSIPLNQPFYYVRNSTGGTLTKGTPVYAAGTVGASGRITVDKFIADGSISVKYYLGILYTDILNGNDGLVLTQGTLRKMDTSSFTDGQVLYVSDSVAGTFTATEPTSPNLSIATALVIYAHATAGSIAVRATNLDENVYQEVLAEGAFVDGDKTKLDGIEIGATVDQTGAEIKTLYEGEADTNAFTDAEQTKLSNIETSADVTDEVNVGSSIHGATAKTTPVDADTMPLIDSAAANVLKKVTWANIKGTLKTYFDTLYHIAGGTDVPISDGGTGASTAADARTNLGVDAAGTDNSTDVSLAGTPDYITISGQVITRNQIDLTADVTGVLPEANLPNASTTAEGVVELATTTETNTGTDTTRAVTPDALAGSNFGIRYVQIRVFEAATYTATGDGKATFKVPAGMDGMNLVSVDAEVDTAGTTGTTDIQIHNVDNALDMLSTKLTIDSGETGSDTAATAAVINTSNDHVNTNDIVRIDVDAVSTTAAQGLLVTLGFQLP